MKTEILLADDETTFRNTFAMVLREEGMSVHAVDNGTDAIAAVMTKAYPMAILDIQMPGTDGIRVLREIMKIRPEMRVIMITAYGTVEMAVEAIKLGACDYVVKPVMFDDILAKIRQHLQYLELQQENKELRHELQSRFDVGQIVGNSHGIKQVFEIVRKVAGTKSNILITGESGTGKELVARAIHALGSKSVTRFVAVNCNAIPEGLIESELFGHKKGSFTSAVADKKGLFESAHNGTLFLDEIGYMPMGCQVKLLRSVEQRQILPVGSTEPVDIDVRLIAATNRNLTEEIKAERFREDLYYRINVVGIHLPPLRDRKEDIPLLVKYFVKKYNSRIGKHCTGVSDEVMKRFMDYEWKGNIRELQNVIERAVIFAESEVIEVSDIGQIMPAGGPHVEESENLEAAMAAYEKWRIWQALNKYHWDKAKAAKVLGVGLSSLYRKIDELGIKAEKQKTGKAEV